MRRFQQFIFPAFCLACVIAALGVFSGCSKKESDGKVVRIGLIVPLTGDIAAMGQGMNNGATLAIEHANARDDVKAKGIRFELAPVDDRADPKEAVNGANKLISDPRIVGVAGHLNSGCSIPASKVYARKSMIMISPASTNPKLTLQGYKNVFRVCTTDNVQGSFAAEYLFNKRGIKRVAVMHDKTPYGQGLAEEFRNHFKKIGGQALTFEGINFGDKDFNAVLTKIKSLKPQAIYFGGMYSEGGLITKQAKNLGMNVPLVGGDGIFSPEYFKIAGAESDGDIATMIGAPPEKIESAKSFVAAYKKRFPGVDFQPYDAYTYDAVSIIVDAVMHVGTDRAAIVKYVSDIKFDGVIGETRFDRNGDTTNKAITVYIARGGQFEAAD